MTRSGFVWCHPDPQSESFLQLGPDGQQWFGIESGEGVIRCLNPVEIEQ